jgi:hypothetical protein
MKRHQTAIVSPTNFDKVVSVAEGFKHNTQFDMS